jgi:hypothetical protein
MRRIPGDWQPQHTAKNLAISIAIEAVELSKDSQWLVPVQARATVADKVG